MKSLNPSPESCRRNGVIGLGLVPAHGPATINIKVSHGLSQYEVALPSNSNFGYLKSIISQNLGLKPEKCKLVFGGVERGDDEYLQIAGVMNGSEVLLMEAAESEQKIPEEIQETSAISKGDADVAEVRKVVDKLAQQVSTLQAVVDSGNKVDDKEIICLTEMLMRQLLKLDGIEAEGEGRVQRKMEVRRIQSIVETLDNLKARNSNSSSSTHKNVSATTQWRAFGSDCQSQNTSSPMPSSVPSPMPSAGPSPMPSSSPSPMPSAGPSSMPSSSPSPMPSSSPSHLPHFMPSPVPSSSFSAVPYSVPSPMPYFTPSPVPYYDPSPVPYFIPSTVPTASPFPYYDPSAMSYYTPSNFPSSNPYPVQYYAPSQMPPSAPLSSPSSSNVTQNWEHFD